MVFGMSQARTFCKIGNSEISWSTIPQVIQAQLQCTLFNVTGDFSWQNQLGGSLVRWLHQDPSSLHLSSRQEACWYHNI